MAEAFCGPLSAGSCWQDNSLGVELHRIVQYLAEAATPAGSADCHLGGTVQSSDLEWPRLLGRVRAAAYVAALETTTETARETLIHLLRLWSTTPFVGDLSGVRAFNCRFVKGGRRDRVNVEDGHTYCVNRLADWQRDSMRHVIELTAGGDFRMMKGVSLVDERRPADGWGTASDVAAFERTLAARGPIAHGWARCFRSHDGGLARRSCARPRRAAVDPRERNQLPDQRGARVVGARGE